MTVIGEMYHNTLRMGMRSRRPIRVPMTRPLLKAPTIGKRVTELDLGEVEDSCLVAFYITW